MRSILVILMSVGLVLFPSAVFAGDTGVWESTTVLPYTLASHTSFYSDGYLILLSGANSTVFNNQISGIPQLDGNIPSWSVVSSPPQIYYHSQVINNDRIYLLGGATYPPTVSSDKVYSATFSSGSIGSWALLSSLPIHSSVGAAVVYNNRIYYAGGFDESVYHDEIYFADINGDGTLGSWVLAGHLPERSQGFGMIVNNGHLVVISGYGQTSGFNRKSFAAPINLNGTIGGWTETSLLPEGVNRSGVVVVGSTVYLIGGGSNSGNLNKVYYADLNSNGTLGAWNLSNNHLPQGVCCGSATAANGYIYLTGGYGGDYLDTVYFTKIDSVVEPPVKKIVVVPGIEATWNADALLNCEMAGYDGDWSLGDYATQYYQPLYDALASAEWEVEPFYYDWRQPITFNAVKLKQFINEKVNNGEKVNLVGHSMGGLIGREYVSEEKNNNRLDKMLTAGTPHRGAVVAYPSWSAGELWKENLVEKIALTLILKRCDVWPTHDKTAIRSYIPSIRDLLPVFDYLQDKKTGVFKPVNGMESKNELLLGSSFASPFWGVDVGTIAGNGYPTLESLDVREPSLLDQAMGNWGDGRPTGKNLVKRGDDTVLVENAQLTGADNRIIEQKHINLMASAAAMEEILNFLGTPITVTNVLAETTSALVVAGTGARFEISDQTGKIIKDKDGLITIYNPRPGGKYKLSIRDVIDKTWVGVVKFKSDGNVEWKEYFGKGAKRIGEEVVWK